MDEVMEVVGLQSLPEGDVSVSLVNKDTGASTMFYVDADEAKRWMLGRVFRVRVTRAVVAKDDA